MAEVDVPPAPSTAPAAGPGVGTRTDAAVPPSHGSDVQGQPTAIGPDGRGRIVLASSSPRRRDLLRRIRVEPVVVPADVDETPEPMEAPAMLVRRLAVTKALAVAGRCGPHDVVIGGDTVVAQDGRVLGKPADVDEAARMLRGLSGRSHQAISGVTVVAGGATSTSAVRSDVATTTVGFRALDQRELDWYLASGEWRGKAGAYALQGAAGAFVSGLQGLDSTVIGLPLGPVVTLLRAAGVDVLTT